jgi:putative CocE/NonD family hydrolase
MKFHPAVLQRLLFTSAALLLALAVSAREAEFEATITKDVQVVTRDGVKLATDLYFPARGGAIVPGKHPVILARTPYNKNGTAKHGKYFAERGYVFVAQDTRGRYGSEGIWHWMTDDGPDGVDCAAWIGQQAWSDGQIGMVGTSYGGGTQHAMAMEKTPELKTVIPVDAVSNMGKQSMRNGGAFEMRFWNWIMLNAGNGSRAAKDPATGAALKEMAANRFEYLKHLPLRRGGTPLKLAPEFEDWLIEAMRHGADDEFWAQNNILDRPERYKDIPVYFVGGWYDSWGGNTTANFASLSRRLKSPVYLIMGPWIHGAQSGFSHGQVTFGRDAAIPDELAWRCDWFDHFLKGRDNGVGKAAPFASRVRLFIMGTGDGRKAEKGLLNHGGYWREENEWPLARARKTAFYLQAGGKLTPEKPAAATASTSYVFDPRDPVPTLGGNISSGNDILQQGGWNQRGGPQFWNWPKPIPISVRNDILVFETEPLAEDTEITGEIEVKLWASSSAVDTDFTAKLIDVYPPNPDFAGGFDLNIADGILRARFRETLKRENLMKPGAVYPFTIKLYPTANVFKKGHRIRVDISSSNFPRFDVNPNTGEPLAENRRVVIATNTIVHDREHPSHILLPLIPKQ